MQASSLTELLEVAASLLRSDPRDPDAISGADYALATSLDTLQYVVQWTQSGGGDSDDECCLLLVRQLDDLGFMQRALSLHEALTLVC